MTELFIDSTPVVLPSNMDLKVKKQNPLVTKNGTFTLDLSISLKERNNSILYKHLERLQATAPQKGRSAVLISDGRIILNGTEAIISNTNEDVKIQLLSGNSELNYFLNSDIYISDLDLGAEPRLTGEYIQNSVVMQGYPEIAFCGKTVKIDTQTYNEAVFRDDNTVELKNPCFQPYLLAMLEKVITALGYTIKENELLQDELASQIYILNNVTSTYYNQFLPGWKAIDFISECETFFNIAFDICEYDKTVRILHRKVNSRFGTYVINNVIDNYERSFDVEDDSSISYKNVKYDLPSSDWYKYQDIDDEILKKALIIHFNNYQELRQFLAVDSSGFVSEEIVRQLYKTMTIFYVKDTETHYIIDKYLYVVTGPGESGEASWHYIRPINRFGKYKTDNNEDDFVSLKFIPAQILNVAAGNMWIWSTRSVPYQSEKLEDTEESETDFNQYVLNGIKNKNATQKQVCLAINKLSKDIPTEYQTTGSAIDIVAESAICEENADYKHRTLRITGKYGLYSRYYNVNRRIDTTKEYTIKFIISTMPDVRADFMFNNKLFICKELEYRVTNEGIHPEVFGTFYEIE